MTSEGERALSGLHARTSIALPFSLSCALVLGCGAGPAGGATGAATSGSDGSRGDPTDGPSGARGAESQLHAFVVAMCSEAARALQDSTVPLESRMSALEAWGREPARELMIRELGVRSEAMPSGTELERAQAVLRDVAPDVDCSALYRLYEEIEARGS